MSNNRADFISTFQIIKGALIEETYVAFQNWDLSGSTADNLRNLRYANAIGAKSTNWLIEVSQVLSRRFAPDGADRTLVDLAQQGCPLELWRPILLWHMAQTDVLLRDFYVKWLYPRFRQGIQVLRAQDLLPHLQAYYDNGLVQEPWKESTQKRVASGLLRIAADFGLLRGKVTREFVPYHLPEESFLYLLHAMAERQPNAHKIVHSTDWRMFLMDAADVERELFRLHQFRRVHYEVAGSLAQLKLPCDSAADYAREMVA